MKIGLSLDATMGPNLFEGRQARVIGAVASIGKPKMLRALQMDVSASDALYLLEPISR